MNRRISLGVLITSLLVAAATFAQNATLPAAAPPLDPEQLKAQWRQTNEELAALQGSLAQAQSSAAGSPLQPVTLQPADAASMASPAPNAEGLGSPKKVPRIPSDEEVNRLEQQLSRARAQRRAVSVADSGLITATSASAQRSLVVFPYVDTSIYEVFAAPDRMTAIELQPGEIISTDNGKPKAADTVQWVADTVMTGEGPERRVIVMIKPIVTGIETNMLIPTNRHLYSILLRAESRAYMPLVAFSYPPDEVKAINQAREARQANPEPVALQPDKMNFAYAVKGAKVIWSPLRVFDDGSKTYLQMPPAMKSWESPALFVLEEKNRPELVNYRVKGNYYIVDRLFLKAQLRVGTKEFVNITRENSG